MSTSRVLRGQPPSPPQSPSSSTTTTESKLDPIPLNTLYSNPESLGLTGFNGPPSMKMSHENDPQSLNYAPNPYIAPNSDYSRWLPIQHSVAAPGINVNTPPPGADELVAPDNVEPMSSLLSNSKSTSKARVIRAPRISRRARKAKERSKAKIDTPLSVSTKHLTHIPLRDIDGYVNRPISERKEEVTRRNGRIARPMNSFMLYRSAYAERTKELSSQNNHQVVSETAGDSWKIEPKEIREKYENLANIEKARHLQAHPGYKFSPSKKDKQPGEERSEPDVEQEGSHMSSPSFAQVGRGMNSSGVEGNNWDHRDFNTPFDQDQGLPSGSFLSSSWQAGHPGRPFSGMISSEPPAAHYMPSSIPPGVLSMQEFQYTQSTPLAGLPGGTHQELLQPQTSMPMPSAYADGQLDPQLLKRESPSPAQAVYHNGSYHMWQDNPANNYYMPATASIPSNTAPYAVSGYHPGMQRLMDHRDVWAPGQETGFEAPGGEFDSWIESNQPGY